MAKHNSFKSFYALSMAWQLGFLIALPIVGFLFLGIWADKFFGTEPVLLFVGLFVGIILTVYEVYHMLGPLLKKEKKDD